MKRTVALLAAALAVAACSDAERPSGPSSGLRSQESKHASTGSIEGQVLVFTGGPDSVAPAKHATVYIEPVSTDPDTLRPPPDSIPGDSIPGDTVPGPRCDRRGDPVAIVKTGGNGKFKVHGLAPGAYAVAVVPADSADGQPTRRCPVFVRAGETTEVTIVLLPPFFPPPPPPPPPDSVPVDSTRS